MPMWKVTSNDIITFLITQEQNHLLPSLDLASTQPKETPYPQNFKIYHFKNLKSIVAGANGSFG